MILHKALLDKSIVFENVGKFLHEAMFLHKTDLPSVSSRRTVIELKFKTYSLRQVWGTYGSRARCGSFDDGIWLACYFLNTIVTNETFSVIFHLPHYKAISNTMQHQKSH